MSSESLTIRRVEADDAQQVLNLVKADFARVAVRAGLQGLDYVAPTRKEVERFEATLDIPRPSHLRLGAFLGERVVAYLKRGPVTHFEMAPYVGGHSAKALDARGWYKGKDGLYTLATDEGIPLESDAVNALVERSGLFTNREVYIPSLVGDEEMREFLTVRGARQTAFLGDIAVRNVTQPGTKIMSELWHYEPHPAAT